MGGATTLMHRTPAIDRPAWDSSPTLARVSAFANGLTMLPPVLSEKRRMIKSFQEELHSFALELLECIAIALSLPKTQFASPHNRGRPNFDNCDLMHYPA